MSTISDEEKLGHNVEVYTLLHHVAEPRGLIAMGIGLGAHFAESGYCRNGIRERLRVDLKVYILEYGELRSYEREFAAQPCGGTPVRITTNLVPSVLLGNGRTAGPGNAE